MTIRHQHSEVCSKPEENWVLQSISPNWNSGNVSPYSVSELVLNAVLTWSIRLNLSIQAATFQHGQMYL